MDGVSPYRSIKRCLWPIVGHIVGTNTLFIIAIWCGSRKEPSNVHDYLSDFVNEAKDMMRKFTWNGRDYRLKIRKYIADAPARAFLRNVQGHNSYFACERCNVRGQWSGRIVYQANLIGDIRTDDTFANRLQAVHHKGPSPLEELGTRMVSQWPLEGMHLVHLGVMKRILQMLCSRKKASIHKLSDEDLESLSSFMASLAPYCPSEFSRRPRSLSDWKLYKATEFRRILLYDGILLFKKLPNQVRVNFLLLHCAMRILSDKTKKEYYGDADYLLKKFVEHSARPDVYGRTFVVYNVHHLLHFASECMLHGSLEEFSAYKYENFMGTFKDYLHAPGRTLQQIISRIVEQAQQLSHLRKERSKEEKSINLSLPHSSGPHLNLIGQQFRKIESGGMIFKLSLNDSCCLMKSGEIVEMKNIVKIQNGSIWIVGQAYAEKRSYYSYPMESSLLGIFAVSKLLALKKWPLEDVQMKYMRLPISEDSVRSNSYLCIPILQEFHS